MGDRPKTTPIQYSRLHIYTYNRASVGWTSMQSIRTQHEGELGWGALWRKCRLGGDNTPVHSTDTRPAVLYVSYNQPTTRHPHHMWVPTTPPGYPGYEICCNHAHTRDMLLQEHFCTMTHGSIRKSTRPNSPSAFHGHSNKFHLKNFRLAIKIFEE